MKLAQVVHGAGSRTLVFLHGLLLDGTMFAPTVAHLPVGKYRCVIPDLPGHGLTPPPETGDAGYACKNQAHVVVEAIEREGKPVDLIGFSLGGFIALWIAILWPALVRSLCLISTSAGVEPPRAAQRYRNLMQIARIPVFGARLANRLLLPEFLDPKFRRTQRGAVAAILKRLDSNSLSMVKPATEAVLLRESVAEQLRHVRIKTLCIAGECDRVRPPKDLALIRDWMPAGMARVQVVPTARHLVPLTHGPEVAELLDRFLDEESTMRAT